MRGRSHSHSLITSQDIHQCTLARTTGSHDGGEQSRLKLSVDTFQDRLEGLFEFSLGHRVRQFAELYVDRRSSGEVRQRGHGTLQSIRTVIIDFPRQCHVGATAATTIIKIYGGPIAEIVLV